MQIKKGFTLSEILITVSIIGILMALTISNIGNKIDRNKALFKKGYSTAEKIVASLIDDKNLYPDELDRNKFGFKQTDNVKIPGAHVCIDGPLTAHPNPERDEMICKEKTILKNCTLGTTDCEGYRRLLKFCKLFNNANNLTEQNWDTDNDNDFTTNCNFTTTDNLGWKIDTSSMKDDSNISHNGFLITIDTNGGSLPNKPENYDDTKTCTKESTDTYCKELYDENRDRFFILVRYDGKIIIPSNDETIKDFISSSDFNKEKKENK